MLKRINVTCVMSQSLKLECIYLLTEHTDEPLLKETLELDQKTEGKDLLIILKLIG